MACMTPTFKWSRRAFVGTALVGAGAAAGALIRQGQNPGPSSQPPGEVQKEGFAYDVVEFENTDPRHLLYEPTGSFDTGFDHVKRLATAPGGFVFVAGDRSVKLLNALGVLHGQIKLERPPHCLHVTGADELLVGFGDYFEAYDFSGKQKHRSQRFGKGTFLTAIGSCDTLLFLADAGHREVLVCNRRTGEIRSRFGKKDDAAGVPGFVVPSPYFDLAVSRDRLLIANPGRLRIESYTFDGHFESSWGQPGMAIDHFCGCCNPVYFARLPDGGIITSEKGLARVNCYTGTGVFKGAVAGPETLVDDKALAKRACADCRLGAGFDVACENSERVFVLDPFRKIVRMFRLRQLT